MNYRKNIFSALSFSFAFCVNKFKLQISSERLPLNALKLIAKLEPERLTMGFVCR